MFGRKKAEEKPTRDRKSRGNLPLLGYDVEVGEEDDGDADLERELSALVGGGSGGRSKPKKPQVSQSQLNAMVADCMKDFEDEDMSDTDDPDLLAELEEFEEDSGGDGGGEMELGVSHSYTETIRERLALYKEAEAVAASNGDSGRARRFNRGVKTLQELERRAAGGLAVKEEDIPPVISVGKRVEQQPTSSPASSPATEAPVPAPAPQPPGPQPGGGSRAAQQQISVMNGQIAELEAARQKYKRAALAAKTGGDREAALEMMKLIKTCDNLLLEVRQGNVVDLALIRPSETQVWRYSRVGKERE